MGLIKEPKGINFIVDPKPLSAQDKKEISEIIAHYKATGKKIKAQPVIKRRATRTKTKKETIAKEK